jgi:hypothetical protein
MPDAQRIVPFRQTPSGRVTQQLAMKISGRGMSKRTQQKQLPRRRLQQIGAPHDFRDPHRRIVHYHCQLVSGNIVAPPDEEIAEIEIVAGDIALPPEIQIRKLDCLTLRNAKAPVHAPRLGGAGHILALTTSSGIYRLIIVIGSARRLRQILARTNARIEKPARAQPPPGFQIMRPALTLRVRATFSATIRPLTPANSEPAQIFNHGASEFAAGALRIQILVPQHQSSVIFNCPLRRDPESPCMTNMQKAGRRGREASAIICAMIRRMTGRKVVRSLIHKSILAGRLWHSGDVLPATRRV